MRNQISMGKLSFGRKVARFVFLLEGCVIGLVLLIVILPEIARAQLPGLPQAHRDEAMQKCHVIALALFSYATDNGGTYPDGKSSTEVFQKLLDGKYISDRTVFFTPIPGKIALVGIQKLKPENVCFDFTAGVDADSSDEVPLVFSTGYKVTYVAGSAAVPLAKPAPAGIQVGYKSNAAKVIIAGPDGSVASFVSPSFNANGKTYRQLTP